MSGIKGFIFGLIAAGAAALAALVWVGHDLRAPEPDLRPAPGIAQPAPQAADPSAAEVEAAPPTEPQSSAPRLDLVRVEPDGAALVAGATMPDAEIAVLIDEAVVARVRADGSGAFVAAFDLPPGGERLLRLDVSARLRNGLAVRGDPVFMTAPRGDEPAPEPPLVAAASPEGVEIAQAPPRQSGAPVTLDLLSYAEDGAVLLQGRAAPQGLVRVYADAMILGETRASPQGDWRVEAGRTLAPGDYVLRVDEIGPTGAVVSRIETPFERVAAEDATMTQGEIVVQPGDSLWRLAQRVYGQGVRYTLIYQANDARIRDPDLIYPGQVLEIPEAAAER